MQIAWKNVNNTNSDLSNMPWLSAAFASQWSTVWWTAEGKERMEPLTKFYSPMDEQVKTQFADNHTDHGIDSSWNLLDKLDEHWNNAYANWPWIHKKHILWSMLILHIYFSYPWASWFFPENIFLVEEESLSENLRNRLLLETNRTWGHSYK